MGFTLPSNVTLLGRDIPVTRARLKGALAQFDRIKMVITMSTTCPDDQAERVLVHEMIHAALYLSGVQQVMSEELEEAVCTALENLVPAITIRPPA